MDVLGRDELIQRLYDAFEDAGLYSPDRDMVEGVYEDAVEPLRRQLATALEALHVNALSAARVSLAPRDSQVDRGGPNA